MAQSTKDAMLRDSQILVLPTGSTAGYAEYGAPDGWPVIALHGAPASRLMFAAADEAAKSFALRVIAPDRPGYGLTPADDDPTLASRTEWLHAFADAMNLNRFALLGISGGSPYAVSLAARLQDRIVALALVSPMGPVADYAASADASLDPVSFLHDRFFMHMPYRTWLTHPLGDLSAWMYRHGPEMFMSLMPKLATSVDAPILSRPDVAQLMRTMTLEAFRQGGSGGTADLEIYGRPWGVQFRDVTAPAVVWQGTEDHVVPPQAARWLARQLPNGTLHSLEGAGHFWVFEHVKDVVSELAALMSQSGTAAVRVS
jgi:pimeloyl-ACP methyl ester carboxylesterase